MDLRAEYERHKSQNSQADELKKIVEETFNTKAEVKEVTDFEKKQEQKMQKIKNINIEEVSLEMAITQILNIRSEQLNTHSLMNDMVSKLVDVKDAVNTKKLEKINTLNDINLTLRFISKHMKKWFWSILILFGLLCFVLGGITNENKEDIYPVLGKAWDLVDGLRQIKNVKSAVDITD